VDFLFEVVADPSLVPDPHSPLLALGVHDAAKGCQDMVDGFEGA
jgi:hypothetical protein